MAEVLAFLGVAVVVIVTPGQDTALTVRNTLAGGRRAGVRTAMGVVAGQTVWVLAASAGVAALLVASEPAFVVVKLAGAAYLVYLGGQALLAAARRERDVHRDTPAASGRARGRPAAAHARAPIARRHHRHGVGRARRPAGRERSLATGCRPRPATRDRRDGGRAV
jgi:threonine/homoserine/homoserine lactone efflux protein